MTEQVAVMALLLRTGRCVSVPDSICSEGQVLMLAALNSRPKVWGDREG